MFHLLAFVQQIFDVFATIPRWQVFIYPSDRSEATLAWKLIINKLAGGFSA